MEHTNLLYYATRASLESDYPDGKVTGITPAVAYAHDEQTLLYNKKKTRYEITVNYEDRSGNTLASSTTIQTPEVLEGGSVKVSVYPVAVEDAKPVSASQKITVTGDSDFTYLYYVLTSYTVTVHHMCEGSAITADTTVVVNDVYEEDSVSVVIEPVSVDGYVAEAVTIRICGDCEYDLEYEEVSYQAIDLDLPSGTLWASCNVGASSPEQYGNYYAWGELAPKSTYTEENYRWYAGVETEYSKYNSTDGLYVLEAVDDVANVEMGGEWHIPTPSQLEELVENTTSSWTTDYNGTGVAGAIFTSNNNGNSIFFPAAGADWGEGPEEQGYSFNVWVPALSDSWHALCLYGDYDQGGVPATDSRFYGLSVRGVLGAGPSPEPIDPGIPIEPIG